MKTKEELERMTKEELVSMVEELQESKEMWFNQSQKLTKRLEAVKGIVKSMVVFID